MDLPATSLVRYIALLRAINVGGHTVKMEALRALFAGLGFTQVETFIASGNVIFHAPAQPAARLEAQIAGHLQQALGYGVATFVRTADELAAIAAYAPFTPADLATPGASLYIAFLAAPPTEAAAGKLLAARNPVDDFQIYDGEIYWLCRGRFSDSLFSGPRLEKMLGQPATVRNSTTVQKMAAKYAAAP
ncbi:MAG: DUF1697 domain-containing protein [Chloroflexota bacterium]|nr:DUF1697 domain-containing protein [Chloroflexota bacterium]